MGSAGLGNNKVRASGGGSIARGDEVRNSLGDVSLV